MIVVSCFVFRVCGYNPVVILYDSNPCFDLNMSVPLVLSTPII